MGVGDHVRGPDSGRAGVGPVGTGSTAHVTQPRMTQIMNRLYLAPDIQESLTFLPRVESGSASIREKRLRRITDRLEEATEDVGRVGAGVRARPA